MPKIKMLSSIWAKLSLSSSSKKESNNFLSSLEFKSCLELDGLEIVLEAIDTTSPANPTPTAVKFILFFESDQEEEKRILRECQLASIFSHQNVLRTLSVTGKQLNVTEIKNIFKNWAKGDERCLPFRDLYIGRAKRFKTVGSICIQMQLYGETLRNWLQQNHDKTEQSVQRFQQQICRDIVKGLQYLHDQKIIHRDVKPENIMFNANGFQLPVKIGGFGLCRTLHSHPESHTSSLTSRAGTGEYMAPEAYSKVYTLQVDLFSLGLVLWEVVQLIKFQERRSLFDALVNERDEEVVQIPEVFSPMKDAIVNLTKKRTTERDQGLEELVRILQEIYQKVAVGFPTTSEELEKCLRDVKPGGRIVLCRGVFQGEFVLKTDGVELVGQGPGKTVVRGLQSKSCLTVTGSDCTISAITIIPIKRQFFNSKGINLIGSRNRVHNLEISGGDTCIHVEGSENVLEELTISNAFKGVEIQGSKNTLDQIKIEDKQYSGVGADPKVFPPTNLLDWGVGIVVNGSHNSLSHINIVRGRVLGEELVGVWFDSSGSSNTISNLSCSGYSRNWGDWGLKIDSPKSSVQDSDCGPIWVEGNKSSLSIVNCGEEISIKYLVEGVTLTECRGQKLVYHKDELKPYVITYCNFDQIIDTWVVQ